MNWPAKSPAASARSPLNLTISTDAAITDGGLILQDAEERHLWDNRLSARLGRLWPELRRQIAIRTSLVAGSGLGRRCLMTPATRTTQPVVTRISGPTVTATGLFGAQMYEVVQVGELGLVGEVVRLIGDRATIQVYEDTTMLKPGAPIQRTGAPLSVWLGPGLVGNIYDGIQRPLPGIQSRSGAWIQRGEKVDPLDPRSAGPLNRWSSAASPSGRDRPSVKWPRRRWSDIGFWFRRRCPARCGRSWPKAITRCAIRWP